MKRSFLPVALFTALVLPLPATASSPGSKTALWVQATVTENGTAPVLLRMETSAAHSRFLAKTLAGLEPGGSAPRAVYNALRNRCAASQAGIRRWLDARAIPYRVLLIANALAVDVDKDLLDQLERRPDIVSIVGNPSVYGLDRSLRRNGPEGTGTPAGTAGDAAAGTTATSPTDGTDSTEWGVRKVKADQVWSSLGVRGEGIVVASEDTGVEWEHPAIKAKYRGWNGTTADHDYNWYDPVGNSAVPIDDHDHGTHTTGTMVGDDGSGNRIGVAPGAKWIACRNMDHGVGSPETYLACMDFFLAPWPFGGNKELDGDPSKAPHIINNSWGCPSSEGCDTETLHDGVASLNAAGILFVASAGNSGPFCSTVSDPPAFHVESFTVGATESSDALAIYSSKGPVTRDGSGRLKPDVAAPGSNVRSSVRGGGYASFSGTSMAGPHVAGVAALLWSAKPGLTRRNDLARCEISRVSHPNISVPFLAQCGGLTINDRPNNLFGYGLVDALEAIQPSQDGDGDGIHDECDCAPADAAVFAPPTEVGNLGFDTDGRTLTWNSQADGTGSSTVYDLLRGLLDDLRADGDIGAASCLATSVPESRYTDATQPVIGEGFYYVVKARNGCGEAGWGADGSGMERTHNGCP